MKNCRMQEHEKTFFRKSIKFLKKKAYLRPYQTSVMKTFQKKRS